MLPHSPWSLKLGHSTSSLPGAILGPLVVHVVQFKVVVFTSVHSSIADSLVVVHQTGLKMVYGSLAFLQTAKGQKVVTVQRHLTR